GGEVVPGAGGGEERMVIIPQEIANPTNCPDPEWAGATLPASTPGCLGHGGHCAPSSGVPSQTLMVLSSLAEARRCPPGLQPGPRRGALSPRSATTPGPAGSHTRPALPPPADASRPPRP